MCVAPSEQDLRGAPFVRSDWIRNGNIPTGSQNPRLQSLEDVGLACPPGNKVKDMDRSRLADAVDPPNALFESHRVPRQLQIDDAPAARLKIQPFACGVRGKKDATFTLHETGESCRPLAPTQTAVQNRRRFFEVVPEVKEGIPVLGKHDDRFLNTTQQTQECAYLAFAAGGGRRRFNHGLMQTLFECAVRKADAV